MKISPLEINPLYGTQNQFPFDMKTETTTLYKGTWYLNSYTMCTLHL